MTDKLRELLEDVQTVYEGKGMVVHPNPFDRLRTEVIKLDNINRLQNERVEKMKEVIETMAALLEMFNSSNGSVDNLVKKARAVIKE